MTRVVLSRCALILLVGMCNVPAYAHDRSESFSEWTWRGDQVHYTFSVLQREVTRIPSTPHPDSTLGEQLAGYLTEQISVTVAGQACAVDKEAVALNSREGFLYVEGSFRCTDPGLPTVIIDTFFDLIPTHTHYARVRSQGRVEEFLLTQDRRDHNFTTPGPVAESSLGGWQAFSQYLEIGARHILAGADHLAFLFGLILLARGVKEMAWLITGFTLGHSLSLALAVLGFVHPNAVMVEALIGFTIALVVIEAAGARSGQLSRIAPWLFVLCLAISGLAWWASRQWEPVIGTAGAGLFALCYLRLVARATNTGGFRLLVTSMFGVVHGFGFAGGLLESNFPASEIAFVLLGFNLGVELGQLLVLLAVMVLLLAVPRVVSMQWQQRGVNATVTVLSGLGTYWFVSRLIG